MAALSLLLVMHGTRHETLGPSCSWEVYTIEKRESELKLFNLLLREQEGESWQFSCMSIMDDASVELEPRETPSLGWKKVTIGQGERFEKGRPINMQWESGMS